MTHEEIQAAADQKRSDAKRKLASMFRIPEGYSSGLVEGIVDDIITATILEISALNSQASKSNVERTCR